MTPQTSPILQLSDLSVQFATADGIVHAVSNLDMSIHAGECVGVVGESGSGKSQSFLAVMQLLAANGQAQGRVMYGGENLLSLPASELNAYRGDRISMIFQDPLTSLTPHMRIGDQMKEVLRNHQKLSGARARLKCLDWLERVRIPDGSKRLNQYPHELSGGMRQRVMIAMAMLCEPDVLIADEPTTALDVTIQAEILDLMDELRREHGTAIALITHDMGVVARLCDHVFVMRHGEVVESGSCHKVFYDPETAYAQMLLEAVPTIPIHDNNSITTLNDSPVGTETLLSVDQLKVNFKIRDGWFNRPKSLKAIDDISFSLNAGESLGIVGESGSGKSTLARAILQLLPSNHGCVSWLGESLGDLDKKTLRQRRRDLQIVFQDPLASLNPSLPIGESITEPLRVHQSQLSALERTKQVALMMQKVELNPNLINRYPHELSGGQNQRVGIARAMILKPKLLILDEAVSALDVSVQAQIIKLIKSLQSEFQLSLIFISHDLSVVYEIAHRMLVMYLGSMVELAPTSRLFRNPVHPYTQQLISAIPIANPELERQRLRIRLAGELTSPLDPAAKLRFLPSRLARGEIHYVPKLTQVAPGHFVADHDPIETLLQAPRV